jgi:hypothetical protein
MNKKTIGIFILLLSSLTIVYAQDYFMYIDGEKHYFEISPNKMLVQFVENTEINTFKTMQAKAQTSNNTIVNDNSSWSVLNRAIDGAITHTDYYYFEGDSILGEHSYKKMFSCNDRLHENCSYQGLMREENQKTYFVYPASETEYLFYDFSLGEGMFFEFISPLRQDIFMLYVQKVDFVEMNGTQKKRIQFTSGDTWIEGVGHLWGILYPIRYGLVGFFSYSLCYHENNELIYKNPDYSECYYDGISSSIPEITNDDYTIFPNPVDDILNISYLNSTLSRIEIFDNAGRKVYNQPYKEKIDVSSFSKGLYLLKVYDTNEQVSVFKIIKK